MQSLTHEELWNDYCRTEAKADLSNAYVLASQAARFYDAREDFKHAGIWHRQVANALSLQSRHDEALAEVALSVKIQPDPWERALSLIHLTHDQLSTANYIDSVITLSQAEDIVHSFPEDAYLKEQFYMVKGSTFCCTYDIDQAIVEWKRGASLAIKSGHAWMAAAQLNSIGFELARQGRLSEAERQLLSAQEIMRKERHLVYEAAIQDSIGYIYTLMGKHDNAERSLNEAARIFGSIPDKAQLTATLLHLSELRERMNDWKAAKEVANHAIKLASEIKSNHLHIEAQNLLSNIDPCTVKNLNKHGLFHGMIYVSDKMSAVVARLKAIAATDEIVLVLGETGTGKELVARAIHQEGKRQNHPFVAFNCSALSRELVESRLFGYRKGAFTGADCERSGVIGAAENGTLFLDEIGDLTLEAQGALLRFLQSGEIQPVGATKPVTANARVIAATNRDLKRDVEAGLFRKDLFYRLNAITLFLPPLWSHREDVPELARHFARLYAEKYALPVPDFTAREMAKLVEHEWPGNARELENYIKQRILFGEASLQDKALSQMNGYEHQKEWRNLSEHEKHQMLMEALENNSGNVTAAARSLRISRRTIQNLRRKLAQK